MFDIAYEKFMLSNGLQVILHEDHALPLTAVSVWYHVGSKDEQLGRTGFAHLFEHVMFEGSKNHNRLFFEPLQKVGATLNGSTSSDRTNYWENLRSNYLELALWLESDRMGFLLDALDQQRFDVQRDVVKNERRQSYENRPYGVSQLVLQAAMFPAPHPYSWPVIGSQADLDAALLEDIKDFFRKFYAPSNASITIAGDFDGETVRRMMERYFGDIPPGPAINRVGRMDSSLRGEVRMDLRDKVQLPRLSLVWPVGPAFSKEEAPLEILSSVLGDGKSSRLHRILVYEKQIARDVRVGNYSQEIAGEFNIQVTASPGHTLEEIQDVVEAELDRIRGEPPDDVETRRAVNRIEAHHVRSLEQFGGFGGRADQLNHYNVMVGDPGVINTDLDRYRQVSGEDVMRVASTALGSDRVRLAVLPEQPAEPTESTVDRTQMPKAGKPQTYSVPTPERHRLPNGLDLLSIQRPGLPMVALGLVFHGGAVTDPQHCPGLDNMTAAMLSEGTATRSSQQIAEEMEFLGSQLDIDPGREHVMLSAETLADHWPKALEVMADVVRNSQFPEREIHRIRAERMADLRRISDDSMAIAQRAGRALVYGPDTAYGHPASGTEESIEALTRGEMMGHYGRRYGPDNATLIVVGDADKEEVLSRALEYLGDWDGRAEAKEPISPSEKDAVPTTLYLADKPGAPQSVVRAGQLTAPRDDPDFYPLTLVNYVFGGSLAARLFMNLRQDKGYSYGYYSTIDWFTGPSVLFAGGAVETGVTKEAVVETLKEFADISRDRPVTDDEYNSARDGIFRGFPSQFETQGQLLNQLTRLVVFGLPDDYYSHLLPRLQAVKIADVRDVAASRIDEGHLNLLVVGDRKVIEPGLSELGLPIVSVDYEGRPS